MDLSALISKRDAIRASQKSDSTKEFLGRNTMSSEEFKEVIGVEEMFLNTRKDEKDPEVYIGHFSYFIDGEMYTGPMSRKASLPSYKGPVVFSEFDDDQKPGSTIWVAHTQGATNSEVIAIL